MESDLLLFGFSREVGYFVNSTLRFHIEMNHCFCDKRFLLDCIIHKEQQEFIPAHVLWVAVRALLLARRIRYFPSLQAFLVCTHSKESC